MLLKTTKVAYLAGVETSRLTMRLWELTEDQDK